MTNLRNPPKNVSIRSPDIREMKLKECFPGDLVRWVMGTRIVDGIIGESQDNNTTTFVALRGMKENDFTVRQLAEVSGTFLNFGTRFIFAADTARTALTVDPNSRDLKGPIVFDDGRWLLQVADDNSGNYRMRWLNLNGGNFRDVDENPVRCLNWRIDLMVPPGYPPLTFMKIEIKRPEIDT